MVLLVGSAAAWGFWSAPGADGDGAAAATTVAAGATPTVAGTGGRVTVTWPASTLADGREVDGYEVRRYDAATSALQPMLTACTGVIPTRSCTEVAVPSGTWRYAVTPVVGSNWRGAESPPSAPLTVDSTAPVNVLTLTSATGAALTADTVHYRGVAAGGFRITNAPFSSHSALQGSTTSPLSGATTGWSHAGSTVSTPDGGPYVSDPFSWGAGTASSPQVTVTGRDAAGNTSATTVTMVEDSTPPAATVDHVDGLTASRAVVVTFTASDTASGVAVATGRLWRASAPLTNGTCGSFSAFAAIGPAAPTSPYTDPNLAAGACYQYQYVVSDRVGNQQTATSAGAARVEYAGTVGNESGLLSRWRLGEKAPAAVVRDTMTRPSGSLLSTGPGELGTTWAYTGGNGDKLTISPTGTVYRNGSGRSRNTASWSQAPTSADYAVEADFVSKGALTGDMTAVIGRYDSVNNRFYMARWEQADRSWNLAKFDNGTITYLDYATNQPALVVGQAYRVRLEMVGASLRMYVNGSLVALGTDTLLSAAGSAGIYDGDVRDDGAGTTVPAVTKTATTGVHLDNVEVTPPLPRAADGKGPNPAFYRHVPTLGATGALAGDSDTAARFDGIDDHVQATTTGLPTGAAVRSVEAWFKTTSGSRQAIFGYGSPAASQEFGLWLNSGGASMTAWGHSAPHDKTFTLDAPVNDGAWHHVVQTYDGTHLTLYVDGVGLPPQAATRNTVADAYGFAIGAILAPGDPNTGAYFNGWIDEVSFYGTVLSAATVAGHHQLGIAANDTAGPVGGSVDASGLGGTGGRWSTSTTLSLALDRGSDPSGLAPTGATLARASAPMTAGTCGTYGSFAPVAGGADPVSPYVDAVADRACYRYRYTVPDSLGNARSWTSPDIKVDATPPPAPALAFSTFTNTWWSGTGSTVHYRSGVNNSFRIAVTASDPDSGIASYTYPPLIANGTQTTLTNSSPTYSWPSTTTIAPGVKTLTSTNNAGAASPGATFTMAVDDTAPTGATVSYADTGTSSTAVTVALTNGTDGGSGLGTRVLQRGTAPMTDGTCGASYAFTTVATNPGASYTDTVGRGSCYRYRYVVSDNVGNAYTATSPSTVKVWPTYYNAISAAAGLNGWYRLNEAPGVTDSFTGTAGTTLQLRTADSGATWAKFAAAPDVPSDADAVITAGGRIRKAGTTTGARYTASLVPAGADYSVGADVHVASEVANDQVGVMGRVDTTSSSYYLARYEQDSDLLFLFRIVNGTTWTVLGQAPVAMAAGSTSRLTLSMTQSTIRVLVNGAARITVTDSAIAGPGRGGVALGYHPNAMTTLSDTTGFHLDNFRVTPAMADSAGANHGDYRNGVVLGATGAVAGNSGTAAQFDGVDDHATFTRQVGDDFSLELWFRSTQGRGTGTQWFNGAGMVDADVSGVANDFGVSLRSDGRVVAGTGNPDTSVVSTNGGYHDGVWHHVVFTRTRATGALALYVDGVAAGTATGGTQSLSSAAVITLGRLQSGTNAYQGFLDEVSVYHVALSADAVAAHHGAAR